MPEFGQYLSAVDALRLAVQTRSIADVARGYREFRKGEADEAKALELLKVLVDLVFEYHGPLGVTELMQDINA